MAISEERQDELSELFWAETNDEDSQEWRNELTAEEAALVAKWDGDFDHALGQLVTEIHNHTRAIPQGKC